MGHRPSKGQCRVGNDMVFINKLIVLANGRIKRPIFLGQLVDSSRSLPHKNLSMTHSFEVVDELFNLALMQPIPAQLIFFWSPSHLYN